MFKSLDFHCTYKYYSSPPQNPNRISNPADELKTEKRRSKTEQITEEKEPLKKQEAGPW